MPAQKTQYQCNSCNHISSKWLGKCPNCFGWNTFAEQVIDNTKNKTLAWIGSDTNKQSIQLKELNSNIIHSDSGDTQLFYPFASQDLNAFWNRGMSSDAVTLLSGEPGLGKSTLALQILRSLHLAKPSKIANFNLLYVSAEESINELARRSNRLNVTDQIHLSQMNQLEQIETLIKEVKPAVTIIDSIQTIYSSSITSNPGSVSQVTSVTSRLLILAKSLGISILIIGHVTKDGSIAGPKTLEHMVDSVLLIEKSDNLIYRTLTFTKHRFGSTENLLLLKMQEDGLSIVQDPSLALLENIEKGVGICYGVGMDKNLTFIVELQVLVSNPVNQAFGRRESIGFKSSKLNAILAIMEKYLYLDVKNRDIYLQVTGMPKSISDDNLDLPIMLAVISSYMNKSVEEIIKTTDMRPKQVFAGRLTFSGNLRVSTNLDQRKNISKQLGFEFNPKIEFGNLSNFAKVIIR